MRVIVLIEPYMAPVRAGRGEPDWLAVVEVPAAVVDAYLLDPRPFLRQIGAHRDSQLGVADPGYARSRPPPACRYRHWPGCARPTPRRAGTSSSRRRWHRRTRSAQTARPRRVRPGPPGARR